jgi:hypothetical protein
MNTATIDRADGPGLWWLWSLRAVAVAAVLAAAIMLGVVIGRATVVSHRTPTSSSAVPPGHPLLLDLNDLKGYAHLPRGLDGP